MVYSRMEELLKAAVGDEAELSPPESRAEELLYRLIQNGSVSSADVADEVAKIVAESPDALDDLKEISNWIASHPQDASEINSRLTALENLLVID